jgi:hypothetical protein
MFRKKDKLSLQGSLSSSDVSNFNARLVIVENELAMLRRKTPQVCFD